MLPTWRPVRDPKAQPVRKLSQPRIGPTMAAIRDYVSCVPGCTKAAALRGSDRPVRGLGAYRPMNRAIAAGLVIAEQTRRCGPYRLFASARDRELYHLRSELMASPSPERAGQLVAQIEKLRAEQMATWSTQ